MKIIDKNIAQEIVQRIKNANESVKGTHSSMQYHMETYYKYGNKWRFLSWGYPIYKVDNIDVYYKKRKDSEYLIFEKSDGEVERFTITPQIRELIGELL